MKKRPSRLLASIAVFLLPPWEVPASPPPGHGLHCLPLVLEPEPLHAKGAAKRLGDLDSGEPRTVRLLYFRPDDRPFRAEVVDSMKTSIRWIQAFFAQQMQAHGHGDRTFRFETDAEGEPVVHRLSGQHPDSHYISGYISGGSATVEIGEAFDLAANIYFTVIDNSTGLIDGAAGRGGRWGGKKVGGLVQLPSLYTLGTAAHELGHAFGLQHDFRNERYLMSYGRGRNRVSACAADFLAVHPYFDPDIPVEWGVRPTVELLSSSEYPEDATSVSVQLRLGVPGSAGLHQVLLLVPTRGILFSGPISWRRGHVEVKSCRGLAGETETVVEFEYDGIFPSSFSSSLSDPPVHPIRVQAVDTEGNVGSYPLYLRRASPHRIATLDAEGVTSMAVSPDGDVLALGRFDTRIQLWEAETRTHTLTLEGGGHLLYINTLAFSPDGRTLASGAEDAGIRLWDVTTGANVATLEGHTDGVDWVAFSPDGTALVSRSWDQTVKLWDLATGTGTTILQEWGSVAISPDGTLLAFGLLDGAIKLWDRATGTDAAAFEGHSGQVGYMAFSPDGTTLASASENEIKLWDVATGRTTATLQGYAPLVFSPDGILLAFELLEGTIKLWDRTTETFVAIESGHGDWVHSMAFSSDGQVLVSWGGNTLMLWDASGWTGPRPRRLVKVSGDGQQGSAGASLDDPLVVEVRDQNDDPLPGVLVTFKVTQGDGRLGDGVTLEKARTGADGRAVSSLTLGSNSGTHTVEGSVGGLEPVRFHAVAAGSPTLLLDRDWTGQIPTGAVARLGKGSLGQSDQTIAFSPDGQYLAVASSLGIWLYETATSRPPALLPSENPVGGVAFSPDGRTLVSAAYPGEIRLWDLTTGRTTATLQGFAPVAFSPDGKTLAFKHPYAIKLWNVETETDIATLERNLAGVLSAEFSPDGLFLASGEENGTVRLWDLETKEDAILGLHTREIHSLSFSPDGTLLAAGAGQRRVSLWDVATGTRILTTGFTSTVFAMRFSPDGRTLAVGLAEGAVKLWDVATSRITATLKESSHWVHSVAFSSDGATLASASVHEGTVRLWNLATENAVVLEDHGATVTFVRFSPDGTRLAVGSYGAVTLWNVVTGGATRVLVAKEWSRWWTSGAFSPDGKILAAVERSNVWLWDLDRGTYRAVLEGEHRVTSVSFSPDGATVAAAQVDGTVQQWDVATRQPISSTAFEGKGEGPLSVAFLPDGTLLASGQLGSTVRLWDGSTGRSLATLEGKEVGGNSPSLSPDGTVLVTKSSNNRNLQLWDVAAERRIATLEHVGVSFVTFSPDGTLLVSGTKREVMLWDVETGTNLGTLEGTGVTSMSFSPDGRTFASGGDNGVTLLWDLRLILPHPQTLTKLSGDLQQGPARAALDEPFVVSVLDQDGDPFAGATVTFAVTAGGGTLSAAIATTDSNGRAAATLTLGNDPGRNTVAVRVDDLKPLVFSAMAQAIPTTLIKVSGDKQEGPAGAALSQPFVVLVRDQTNKPLEGAQVRFAVTAGEGSLSATLDTTDANGRASATLTLGRLPGANTVSVRIPKLRPVAFIATGQASPTSLTKISGDGQQAAPGATLAAPFVVSVLDQNGAAFAGATVTFAVTAGEGTLSATTAPTDENGRATATLTLGLAGANTVKVSMADLEPVTFTATAEATSDFDGDGETAFSDFFLLADAFGSSDPRFDLDGSGTVDFSDFFLFADHFADPARGKLLALARERIGLPDGPQLQQNAPNPFNSETVISWFLLRPGPARVEVFSLTGQRVAVLHQGPNKAGVHRVHWNGRDDRGRPLASGVYLYRLVTTGNVQTRKLTLLR